jgi:uncharacterized repeat protein (TIGR03803 family)
MRNFKWVMRACGIFLAWAMVVLATPAQTFHTIHHFSVTDGEIPSAALVQGTDGNLYGVTESGGASIQCTGGCGTVFKITPTGTLTTLYNFCLLSGCADGEAPTMSLVQDADGNFYGTTVEGGADSTCNNGSGCGTVFKVTPSGVLTTLHSFDNTDGEEPEGNLILASDGNF